jgi:hypothetical protein
MKLTYEELERRLAEMTAQAERAEAELVSLQEEYEVMRNDNADLRAELETSQRRLNLSARHLAESESETCVLRAKLANAETDIVQLKHKLRNVVNGDERNSYEMALADLRAKLAAAEDWRCIGPDAPANDCQGADFEEMCVACQVQQLSSKLAAAEARYSENLKTISDDYVSEHARLNAKLAESKAMCAAVRQEAENWKQLFLACEALRSQAEAEVALLEQRENALEQQNWQTQDRVSALELELNAEKKAHSLTLADLLSRSQALESEHEELEKIIAELIRTKAERDWLNEDPSREEIRIECDAALARAKVAEATHQKLQIERDTIRSELTAVIETVEAERDALRAELELSKNQEADWAKDVGRLRADLETAKRLLRQVRNPTWDTDMGYQSWEFCVDAFLNPPAPAQDKTVLLVRRDLSLGPAPAQKGKGFGGMEAMMRKEEERNQARLAPKPKCDTQECPGCDRVMYPSERWACVSCWADATPEQMKTWSQGAWDPTLVASASKPPARAEAEQWLKEGEQPTGTMAFHAEPKSYAMDALLADIDEKIGPAVLVKLEPAPTVSSQEKCWDQSHVHWTEFGEPGHAAECAESKPKCATCDDTQEIATGLPWTDDGQGPWEPCPVCTKTKP